MGAVPYRKASVVSSHFRKRRVLSLLADITTVVSQPLRESITGLISGTVVKFGLINTLMTWTAAQKYCREYHSDLASVRNMTENQKIQQLVPARNQVWIGLYRDAWKWSDGRNFSLSYWNSIEPNHGQHGENCVSAAFNAEGKWEDWTCDLKKAFICYSYSGESPSLCY
uniref:C-type lectin domain-containing protein n=1 Tax=Fundulus heteroclitus TaxID=8078 RepID=A0A3Q2PXB2_FUNHE